MLALCDGNQVDFDNGVLSAQPPQPQPQPLSKQDKVS